LKAVCYTCMTDTMTKEQRHECMAAIKGKDTKPEMIVRRFLHAAGYRYRLHDRKLPGCPDLVFPGLHTVIFIHGCFWHGHENCKYFRLPKSNVEFWQNKIDRNRKRDVKVRTALEEQRWNVITVWECGLRDKARRDETLKNIVRQLFDIRNHTHSETEPPFTTAAEPEPPYGE